VFNGGGCNIAYTKSREELFKNIENVLMDTWYATTEMMLLIEIVCCSLYT